MENTSKIIITLVIVALTWFTYQSIFSGETQLINDSPNKEKTTSQREIVTDKLTKEYQATSDWESESVYTLQTQKKLLNGRPALFRGYVDDIFSRNNETFIRFSSEMFSPTNYVLELQCDQHIIDKIMKQTTGEDFSPFFDEFALIANIRDISKPVFALEGSSFSEDEVEIDVSQSNLLLMIGSCVDIEYTGDLFEIF